MDCATGEEVQWFGSSSGCMSAAFSPDGQRIITGGTDKTARIWDVQTGRELLSLNGHSEAITTVAFSKDGLAALTCSNDKTAIIWPALDYTKTREEILKDKLEEWNKGKLWQR